MFGTRQLPMAYTEWSRKWGAPFGFPFAQELIHQTDMPLEVAARLAGPFAFQANNTTRSFEYPWAFEQIDHSSPKDIVDVGGGVTGMQFVLSMLGHRVRTVDPGLASTDYGWGSRLLGHESLNAVFSTSVAVHPCYLEDAGLAKRSFDYVTCISTMEHAPFDRVVSLIDTALELLKPGGRLVATVDLFLNLAPFTSREMNEFGTNIDIAAALGEVRTAHKLVTGLPSQLNGFPEFDSNAVLSHLEDYWVGSYPCLCQCFALEAL